MDARDAVNAVQRARFEHVLGAAAALLGCVQ